MKSMGAFIFTPVWLEIERGTKKNEIAEYESVRNDGTNQVV